MHEPYSQVALAKSPVVIVAERDPYHRSLLTWSLTDEGFRVLEAGDARLALEFLRRDAAQALVIDSYMPHLSGTDVLQALRMVDAHLPVFLLADGQDMTPAKGRLLGAQGVLRKPFNPQALVAMLRHVLLRSRQV
jgi:DNA-binding response OmpR family regulator